MTYQEDQVIDLESELNELRCRVAELEAFEAKYKRADEFLRFRDSILRHIYDAVFVIDMQGRFAYWNQGAESLLGYSKAEVSRFSPEDILVGFEASDYQSDLGEITNGQTIENQTRVKCKDGRILDVDIRTSLLYGAVQTPLGLVSVLRNISYQKQTELALTQSRIRYEMASRAGRVGVWDWNLDTGDMYLDPNLKEMIGYEDDEIRNHLDDWGRLVHPDDRGKAMQAAEAHAAGETAWYELLHRMRHKDGRFRWFLARGQMVPVAGGRSFHMTGTNTDVTELIQAEQSLQRRNEELALLNRAGRAFNSTLDLDSVMNTILQEIRRFLDVVACSVWLLDPQTKELVCRQVADAASAAVRGQRLAPGQGIAGWVVKNGASLNVPDSLSDSRYFRDIDKKTGIFLRSILTVPLKVKDRTIGVIQVVDAAVNRFGSDDLRLVESLAAAAAAAIENARLFEQAARNARAKSLLLEEVNHRVKNNLASIIGLLYAEQRQMVKEEKSACRNVIQEVVARIQGLATAHNLLSASAWSPLPLADLIRQVIQSGAMMTHNGRPFQVDVTPSQVMVSASQANNLALIINELTTNSLKYAVGQSDDVHLTVRIDTIDTNKISVEFRDNGPGYPEQVLQSRQGNVGLYLLMTLIQEDLNGELHLANDQGAVTTLTFECV